MRLNFVACVLLLCVCNTFAGKVFFDIEKDVFFKLYKSENPTNFTILEENSSHSFPLDSFDPEIPTRICIHGYLASSGTIDRFREAFLNAGEFNFILVDWSRGAFNVNYYVSKARIVHVADKLAKLIDALVKNGMKLSDLSIVGHSLGSHLAGLAAKKLNSTEKIGSIIGLDPASVGFSVQDERNRLSKFDADYVQIIHTDIRMYGMAKPFGHADIYTNGGKLQPGCLNVSMLSVIDKCSHARSYELFFESLKSNFTAIKCASYDEIMKNQCTFDSLVTTTMGGNIITTADKPHGIFYLETEAKTPFVISDYNLFKKIIINPPELEEMQTNKQISKSLRSKTLMDILNSFKEKVATSKFKDDQNEIQMQSLNETSIQEAIDRKDLFDKFSWSNEESGIPEIMVEETKIPQEIFETEKQKLLSYKAFINWAKNINENLNAAKINTERIEAGFEMMNSFSS